MRRVLIASICVLIAWSTGVATAYASAPPAPFDGPDTVAVTASKRASEAPGSKDGASAQSTISCTLQINNPHKSTHVPGTINITATLSCSAPVSSLTIDVYLYRNGLFAGEGHNSNAGSSYLMGNAYTGCTSGTYQGVALGAVVFPPGYTPATQNGSVASSSVYISCP